jgi:hypothetical protein
VQNERVTSEREEALPDSTGPIAMAGEPRPSGPKRWAAALVAFAVFAAGAAFAWRTFAPDVVPVEEPTVGPAPASAFDGLPAGWTELPPPPEVRTGAATGWTGTELIVWGGHAGFDERSVTADGFAFDATSRSWDRLPPSPLEARTLAASAWTGSELLVWGGWRGTYGYAFAQGLLDDGAAYDPISDTWRPLAPAPIEGRAPLSVWTGRELLVWGTALRVEGRPRDGAAYDPASDTWRVIPKAPLELTDATAVWTGKEMIVFGAALCCGNNPETRTAIGAAYDPDADTWRRIPDSELSPQASTAAWDGGEMIAWDYLNDSAAYEPVNDVWRSLPRVPLDDWECTPESVAVRASVLGDYCGDLVLYEVGVDAWREVSRRDLSGWEVEPIAAPPAIVLLAQDQLDTSSTRMLAYRPAPEDSLGEPAVADHTPFEPDVTLDGSVARVNVTFPDGSAATVSYPSELEIASQGLQPDVSYIWRDDPPSRHPIVFLHGPPGVEKAYVEGDEPTATIPFPGGGEAALWPAGQNESYRLKDVSWWLVYRTESWSALASLRSGDDAEALASGLAVQEADTGLPFVTTTGPVYLAEHAGEDEGPVLAFGDAQPDPSIVSDLDALIFLSPEACSGGPEFDDPPDYASNCLADGNVFAGIYGDPRFIRAVLDGLRVESFSHPHSEPA